MTFKKEIEGGVTDSDDCISPNANALLDADSIGNADKNKLVLNQWHPGFFAATELELRKFDDFLVFMEEMQLNRRPIVLDMLVRKLEDKPIDNEIGRIFRKYNIFEYKSPGDELSINALLKTIAYAILFKIKGKKECEISFHELTISLVRYEKPCKMFSVLQNDGYEVEKMFNGIYYIRGIIIPAQVIVTHELDFEAHMYLKVLSRKLKKVDALAFLDDINHFTRERDIQNADALLYLVANVNGDLFNSIGRRYPGVYKSARLLFKDEFDKLEAELAMKDEIHARELKEAKETYAREMAVEMRNAGCTDSFISAILKVDIKTIQNWFQNGLSPANCTED